MTNFKKRKEFLNSNINTKMALSLPMDMKLQMMKEKKMLEFLRTARGNGTSMISLIIPAGGKIEKTNQMLTMEQGTASKIKSRVNRQSVQEAITSAQYKLKMYPKLPPNGLVLYCGLGINSEEKGEKISIAFEPSKQINLGMYMCDKQFHVKALSNQLV